MNSGKQKGFTLIEALIVTAVFAILFAGVYAFYQSSLRTTTRQTRLVDLQQNLRIGLDAIVRDVRFGGLLVSDNDEAITASTANNLVIQVVNSKGVGTFTRLVSDFSSSANAADEVELEVSSRFDVTAFEKDDFVRIIRPINNAQPIDRIFKITKVEQDPDKIFLTGFDAVKFYKKGDMVVAVNDSDTDGDGDPNTNPDPSIRTVEYALNNGSLERTGTSNQVVAENVTGLTFAYILTDGAEVADPTGQYDNIKALRIRLEGEVVSPQGQPAQREIETVVYLRNNLN